MDVVMENSAERVLNTNGDFRGLVASAPLLMCLLDGELKGTHFSQPWVAFTGRLEADLLGDQWLSDIHPQDRERCLAAWRKAIDRSEKFELEYRLRRFDGEFRYVCGTGVPQLLPEGQLQHYIQTVVDISARKAAEDALHRSELHRRAVFDSSVGNVAVVDCAGRIIAVNDGWLRFARQQQGRVKEVGRGANYIEVCKRAMEHGDPDAAAAHEGIIGVLDGSLPEFLMEYQCPAPADEFWFEMLVHPLYRPEGGAIITHLNTTKRHRAEVQAQTLLHELAHVSRVAVLGELTAAVTHELSQPLMAMQTNAQAAKRVIAAKGIVDADLEELMSDIIADNSRAEKILQQLRALLKKDRAHMKPLKLNSLIRDVSALLRDEAVRKKMKLSLLLNPDLPFVRGERIQLQQVVLNLMMNAFEAMRNKKADERELTIETSVTDRGEAMLLVKDNGPGIPVDQMDRVFQPFFTTKANGLGMGLAICRSIVDFHGGAISVANNQEKGVSFRIVLPVMGKGNI